MFFVVISLMLCIGMLGIVAVNLVLNFVCYLKYRRDLKRGIKRRPFRIRWYGPREGAQPFYSEDTEGAIVDSLYD